MPRSLAICAIGRPLSSTSRTARSRSSSGYFFGAGIAEVLPLPRMKSWLDGLRQSRPGSVVALELGYALQSRHDQRGAAITPLIYGQVLRWLREHPVDSMLIGSDAAWAAA